MPQLKAKPHARQDRSPMDRECDDLYGYHYRLPLTPYEGPDFSRKCFVFPGQSAAQPHMGKDDLQRFEVLQKRFATADALAVARGLPAPSLFVTDPARISSDQLSVIQCLTLFTMSVGLFELLLTHSERPALITSHSFGEYAAFVASGIASFEDMFDIVCARDAFCPPAGKAGSMIAVSADAAAVKKVINATTAVIANHNSPNQTVISVDPDAVRSTLATLKREGLAAKYLDSIPQPYHSGRLAEAAAKLANYVETKGFAFRAPHTPMLSSVSGRMITDENFAPAEIRDLIAKQLTAPVDFISQIRTAIASGCRHFMELAHHKTCTSWIKDILQGEVYKISVPPVLAPVPVAEAPKNSGRNYDSKLIGFLNKVIVSVTGYSVEEISLSNNFQEDLGIDSIKKAQIVFDFMEGQGDFSIDVQDNAILNQIRTVEDVLDWYMKDKENDGKPDATPALFLRHALQWVEQPLTSYDDLLAMPAPCAWVALSRIADELPQALNESGAIIFYDNGGAAPFETVLAAIQKNYSHFKGLGAKAPFALVTQDGSSSAIRAFDGFFRSLAQETGGAFRSFSFEQFDPARDKTIVEKETALPFARSVRFASGKRFILAMAPRPQNAKPAAVYKTVAAIGGARGITREVLKTLTAQGTRHIYILGRSSADAVQKDLKNLQSSGVAIDYQAGDATDRAVLEKFLGHAAQEQGVVDLLIHGGGVEVSALADKQTPDAIRTQLAVKIDTVRHIMDLCRTLPVKKTVCFSSLAGEWGSAGQTVYAYANMAMTYMCEEAAAAGLSIQTIAWPAWDRIGMTENEAIYRQLLLGGQRFLDGPSGCKLFMDNLADEACVRTVCFDAKGVKGYEKLLPQALHSVFPGTDSLASPLHLKHWTLQDFPDLRDHVILGNTVAPITLSLATFLYLGLFRTGKPCKLTDIKTISFIPLHKKDSPYFISYRQEGDNLKAEIRSNEPHIEATMSPSGAADMPKERFSMQENTEFIPDSKVDYDDCKLRFQITHNTHKGRDGYSYADIDCTKQIRLGARPMHVMAYIIEGMLQMGGMGARFLTLRSSIPFAMKSLAVNPATRITDTYKVVARFTQTSDDGGVNELFAYNADGDLFIHVTGEQIRMWMPAA